MVAIGNQKCKLLENIKGLSKSKVKLKEFYVPKPIYPTSSLIQSKV